MFISLLNEPKGCDELVSRIVELENNKVVIESLIAGNKRLSKDLSKLEARVDDNEQRNRNNCLLLHGIEKNINSNTDQLVYDVANKDLGISLTPSDIIRTHTVGAPKPLRNTRSPEVNPRPIIFKFANFRKRQDVFYSKRKLKGKNIRKSYTITIQTFERSSSEIWQGKGLDN